MSINLNIENLSDENKYKIDNELEIKIENKFGIGEPRTIYPYIIVGDYIKLPFAYSINNINKTRPSRDSFPITDLEFCGELRNEQQIVKKEAIKTLSKKGSIILALHCGFGKTITAINLSITIGFKTLVIVNKIVLMKQWKESILCFCPNARIQTVTTKSRKEDCDFYIINAQNIEKLPDDFFSDIGTVLVDESHLIMAETLSKSLQYVFPRYLIGLTATPYRPDGLDILLELYFGKNTIIRKLHREHIVYMVNTGFKPKIEMSKNGRLNWGTVLDSLSNNEERNELIINILCNFPERNFLVLVKRIKQGEYLVNKLLERGENVTSLMGSNQEFDKKARILIGTISKIGTGFDHPSLDALMLAADVEEYFIQFLGRCMRTKEVEPIVFDLVDNYSVLKKHFNTRRSVYKEHGGIIKLYKP